MSTARTQANFVSRHLLIDDKHLDCVLTAVTRNQDSVTCYHRNDASLSCLELIRVIVSEKASVTNLAPRFDRYL